MCHLRSLWPGKKDLEETQCFLAALPQKCNATLALGACEKMHDSNPGFIILGHIAIWVTYCLFVLSCGLQDT
jgi:hypothetical protein